MSMKGYIHAWGLSSGSYKKQNQEEVTKRKKIENLIVLKNK